MSVKEVLNKNENEKLIFNHEQLLLLEMGNLYECFGQGYELSATQLSPPRILFKSLSHVVLESGYSCDEGALIGFSNLGKDWGNEAEKHLKRSCHEMIIFLFLFNKLTLTRDGFKFKSVDGQLKKISKNEFYSLKLDESSVRICFSSLAWENDLRVNVSFDIFAENVLVMKYEGLVVELVPNVVYQGDGVFDIVRPNIQSEATQFLRRGRASYEIKPEHEEFLTSEQMLSWSLGKLTHTWGEIAKRFAGELRMPRIPAPPFLLMNRCVSVEGGDALKNRQGQKITTEYDFESSDWYFVEGRNDTMPFSLLLDAALQPTSINLSLYFIDLEKKEPLKRSLFVRNLDGECKVYGEIRACQGTLQVTSEIKYVSSIGDTVIASFQNQLRKDGQLILDVETVFGVFYAEAIEKQIGIPISDDEQFGRGQHSIPNRLGSKCWEDSSMRDVMPTGKMQFLDRIVAFSNDGGRYGQGYIRGETDIDPTKWYFKSHFFQDPVMPGSLGLETIVQLLQLFVILSGEKYAQQFDRFQPAILGEKFKYKYRGQVTPANTKLVVEAHLKKVLLESGGVKVSADAALWADGKCIYKVWDIGIEAVSAQEKEMLPSAKKRVDIQKESVSKEPCLDLSAIRSFWRPFLGEACQILEPIGLGIVDKFLNNVLMDGDDSQLITLRTPCIYLASHQTYVESILFNIVMTAMSGQPLTQLGKAEHQMGFVGKFTNFFSSFPGSKLSGTGFFVKKDDPMEVIRTVNEFERLLSEEKRSVLVHVEGRRTYSAADKIKKLSSIWLDLAIKTNRPIVPVRFLGGIPRDNINKAKYDFPVGYGKQDIHVGKPIPASELKKLPYVERVVLVKDRINTLGNQIENKVYPEDLEFSASVAEWRKLTDVSEDGAVIYSALIKYLGKSEVDLDGRGEHVKGILPALIFCGERLKKSKQRIQLVVSDNVQVVQVNYLIRWLFGTNGPLMVSAAELNKKNPYIFVD